MPLARRIETGARLMTKYPAQAALWRALSLRLSGCLVASALLACVEPAWAQHPSFLDWAAHKREQTRALISQSPTEDSWYNEPVHLDQPARNVRPLSAMDRRRNADTIALYADVVGRDSVASLIWTGIESGNPLTRAEDYRWDSLDDQGLFNPARRRRFIAALKSLGIRNVRLGMSNHRIDPDDEQSWKAHDALIRDLSEAGLAISLDLHHFGIEDRFRVVGARGQTVGERSYYLHADWPDYFARFAARAFRRYRAQIKAVTLINEPETTVGFNGEMWHGGFPRWANRNHNHYYIERAVQVAKAAVKARAKIEDELAREGARVLFVHPEAAVFKPYWGDFNRFTRFVVSDLILGHQWLMEADLDALARRPMDDIVGGWKRKASSQRTSLDWVVENYVVSGQPIHGREASRARLVEMLRDLRELHRQLAREHRVTMRTDTVFAVDYYAHNEDRDAKRQRLGVLPEFYAAQVASGRRAGLYPLIVDYFNRYGTPMMIGETGTPYYYYGARWHAQMLLECAQAAEAGIPFLGYTMYPAIDTWGWETALSLPKNETLLNPGGVFSWELKPRPFVARLLASLAARMPTGLRPPAEPPRASALDGTSAPQTGIP